MKNTLQLTITKVERCEKCGAFRSFTIYPNGLREKAVHSRRGVRCKHKWRMAKQEEI